MSSEIAKRAGHNRGAGGNSGGVTAWDKLESFTAYTKKRGGKTGRNATPTQDFG